MILWRGENSFLLECRRCNIGVRFFVRFILYYFLRSIWRKMTVFAGVMLVVGYFISLEGIVGLAGCFGGWICRLCRIGWCGKGGLFVGFLGWCRRIGVGRGFGS